MQGYWKDLNVFEISQVVPHLEAAESDCTLPLLGLKCNLCIVKVQCRRKKKDDEQSQRLCEETGPGPFNAQCIVLWNMYEYVLIFSNSLNACYFAQQWLR